MLLGRRVHRRVAWLALLALWLQLALSFGHTHPEDFYGLGRHDQQYAQLTADHGLPGSPVNPTFDGLAHEACAICASITLAGTVVVPAPPAIAPPRFHRGAPPPLYDHAVVFRAPHLLFETRAPPPRLRSTFVSAPRRRPRARPELRDGKPVASTLDIRIPISVH